MIALKNKKITVLLVLILSTLSAMTVSAESGYAKIKNGVGNILIGEVLPYNNDSGFSSSQFFSRVFRQYFSVNANNWRLAKTTGKILIPEQKKTVLADKVLYPYSHDYMKMHRSM